VLGFDGVKGDDNVAKIDVHSLVSRGYFQCAQGIKSRISLMLTLHINTFEF